MTNSNNNISDKGELRRLLQMFMDGTTSIEQENKLAEYFRNNEVGEEFADYKTMFAVFNSGELAQAEELPMTAINQAEEKQMPKILKPFLKFTAIAASIAIAFFAGMQFAGKDEEPSHTNTEQIAAATVSETRTEVKTDTVFVEKLVTQTDNQVATTITPAKDPSKPKYTEVAQVATSEVASDVPHLTEEEVKEIQDEVNRQFDMMMQEMEQFEQELIN